MKIRSEETPINSAVLPVAALVADVEITGALVFFRASSSGLGAAGAVLALLTGLGSRFMTGAADKEVGKGAAKRLLKVVVVVAVEAVERAGRVEVVSSGETVFSGSGARKEQIHKTVSDMLELSFPLFWLKHVCKQVAATMSA